TNAGEAMEYMAMAGWKTGDMLNGIEPILNLAIASGEELGTTSDIVTDALTAFGLSAKDAGMFSDVLAAASSNANTNVGMMGETFKYAAPVAGSLGYTIQDTALAIGLMANSGIKASQAGTALRAGLTNLVKPSKQMAKVIDKYGISLKNSNGEMKSFKEVMEDLRSKMGNLDKSTQAAAVSA
ncbi:phage tail tape measure protein, partial [Clostridium perfringens]|nr:phage tail tape measure protein [Clostridium perfringens]